VVFLLLALISLGEQLLYFRSLKPLITLPPDLTIHALAIQCLEASVCPGREGTRWDSSNACKARDKLDMRTAAATVLATAAGDLMS